VISCQWSMAAFVNVGTRAATNDYFYNRLIDRSFFRLIDESDKKTFVIAASLFKNWTLHQIHSADWSVKTPGYCSNVAELLKVILNDKKIKKHNWDNTKTTYNVWYTFIYTHSISLCKSMHRTVTSVPTRFNMNTCIVTTLLLTNYVSFEYSFILYGH
jgi:hypothetical protein